VQFDAEPGIKLSIHHQRRLGIQHGAAGQPAADGN
jgi:hypothetical protein